MPGHNILDIPLAEQEQLLAQLRAARYSHLLTVQMLVLCAQAGRRPRLPPPCVVRLRAAIAWSLLISAATLMWA